MKSDFDAADEILCIGTGSFGLPRKKPNRSILVDHRRHELAISFGIGTTERARERCGDDAFRPGFEGSTIDLCTTALGVSGRL